LSTPWRKKYYADTVILPFLDVVGRQKRSDCAQAALGKDHTPRGFITHRARYDSFERGRQGILNRHGEVGAIFGRVTVTKAFPHACHRYESRRREE
jgi:hypothetical protein